MKPELNLDAPGYADARAARDWAAADAIRATGAPGVDVSSGVETGPGEKSPELIERFLLAVKTAKQSL